MRHIRDTGENSCSDHFCLEKMISLLADRHVFQLGDLFFAYLTRKRPMVTDWSWMPVWNDQDENIREKPSSPLPWLPGATESLYRMPNEAKILSVFDCRVGDAVAYKHPGGYPSSLAMSRPALSSSIANEEEALSFPVPPLWLNGTIVSIFENNRGREEAEAKDRDSGYSNILLRIRVWYPSRIEPWEVEISHRSPRLINQFFVAQNWMLPRSFQETQVVLAQKYQQYLDCSLVANTSVRVALRDRDKDTDDNENELEGTVLDWKDFDWKRLLHSCTGTSPVITGYDDFYWNELPVPIKTAAKALGYTRSSWDNDKGIPADSMNWDKLSRVQKDAAFVLGYIQPKLALSQFPESNKSGVFYSNSTEMFWNNVSEISRCSGPHVPVEWENSHQSSFVPLKQIIFPSAGRNNGSLQVDRDTMIRPNSPLTAEIPDSGNGVDLLHQQYLIRGLKSSGKSIENAYHIFRTAELSAFWVEDEDWCDATAINSVYHDNYSCCSNSNYEKLSLDLLSTHFEYTLPGVYCPIEYDDGVRHLIPLNYIFRRGCQPQHKREEGSSGSDSDTESILGGVV